MQELIPNSIYCGDAKTILSGLPDKSVDCCVTSPPYYGLRDYGVTGQLGRETSPEEFVKNLVSVFREVRRVLKDQGTLWIVIGDSYAKGKSTRDATITPNHDLNASQYTLAEIPYAKSENRPFLKPKDLIGVPWSLAFALRNDGWYLRQDLIWQKPNCQPESIKDRCTKSHEYIFMLSKCPKYYYDIDAIRQPHVSIDDLERRVRNGKAEWKTKKACKEGPYAMKGTGRDRRKSYHPLGRNKRSVWTVTLTQTKEAHFATYPEALIVDCIKAGCPVGGVVLDPFMGSGTTAVVALKNGRQYVGVELNPEYIEIAERRITGLQIPDTGFE